MFRICCSTGLARLPKADDFSGCCWAERHWRGPEQRQQALVPCGRRTLNFVVVCCLVGSTVCGTLAILCYFAPKAAFLGRGMFLHVSSKAAKFARCCRFVRNFSLMRLPRVQKPPSRLVFRHLSRTSFCVFSVGKVQGCPILCMTLQCRLDLQSVQ